jgi:Glucose / Sorbosone dehydrogenase
MIRAFTVFLLVSGSAALALSATPAAAQRGRGEGPPPPPTATSDPMATPIRATAGAIHVGIRDFAHIPFVDSAAPRMMVLLDEPGSRRLFVNDMRGRIYTVSYDGRDVAEYLDLGDPAYGVRVQARSRETGFQSFALHPQFNERGTPGFGKLYTWTDVVDTAPEPDFTPGGGGDTHDTVLLEWTARTPAAARYDGAPPRQVLRVQQPFGNHNGGQIAFNPLARAGDADFGKLYIGNADGGSGGDPLNLAQNPASPYGKILRIDPLGRNSANGEYGIPADNPFVSGGPAGALGEVWALGVRNPQRFGWDPANGSLYVADIGQNTVEEISPVTRGANLGWNVWEGSYRFVNRAGVDTASQRSDRAMTYPIAEYDHTDPILTGRAAVTGLHVYRSDAVPALRGHVLFGDNPSGEVFAVSADEPPDGGHEAIRRVLFADGVQTKTLLQLIQEANTAQGAEPATRADLRFGSGPDGRVFLLNKHDGIVREIVAPVR